MPVREDPGALNEGLLRHVMTLCCGGIDFLRGNDLTSGTKKGKGFPHTLVAANVDDE